MKIIFLDHDGVICLYNNFGSRYNKKGYFGLNSPIECRFDNFDIKAIKVLNEILSITNAEIVVSSDWRRWATIEEMGDYYESQGIIKKPIDFTDYIIDSSYIINSRKTELEETRIYQIQDWLKLHPKVTHWVAVDDLDMSEHYEGEPKKLLFGLNNFVHTPKNREGIKQTGVKEKIINFLTN